MGMILLPCADAAARFPAATRRLQAYSLHYCMPAHSLPTPWAAWHASHRARLGFRTINPLPTPRAAVMFAIKTRSGQVYLKMKKNFGDLSALEKDEGNAQFKAERNGE